MAKQFIHILECIEDYHDVLLRKKSQQHLASNQNNFNLNIGFATLPTDVKYLGQILESKYIHNVIPSQDSLLLFFHINIFNLTLAFKSCGTTANWMRNNATHFSAPISAKLNYYIMQRVEYLYSSNTLIIDRKELY